MYLCTYILCSLFFFLCVYVCVCVLVLFRLSFLGPVLSGASLWALNKSAPRTLIESKTVHTRETPRWPLKGSVKGDMGPYTGYTWLSLFYILWG